MVEVLCSLKFFFFFLEISLLFVCLFMTLYVIFLSICNFFPVCCEEMFLILRGPVPVLPGLWISSCSAFLVELTVPSFLLPRTSLLFYHSTDTVFPLDSAFPAQLRPPWAESLYLNYFGSSSASTASFQVTPWIRLNGWLLEVFFFIFTLRRTCLWCQHRRAVGNHQSLVPPCAPCCFCSCWRKLGCGHWGSSRLSPQE